MLGDYVLDNGTYAATGGLQCFLAGFASDPSSSSRLYQTHLRRNPHPLMDQIDPS